MRTITLTASLLVLAGLSGAGCGADQYESCDILEPVDIDPLGHQLMYVVDSIDLPNSYDESQAFGVVLDRNPLQRPNNAMGQVLSLIFSYVDVDLDDRVQSAIDDGRILHLLGVQATSLDEAAGVGAQIFLGVDRDDDPLDNFSGTESFAIEAGNFSQPLAGEIDDGRLIVELGSVPLRIVLPNVDTPFTLELEAARIEADVITTTEIRGKLGGVILEEELHASLLPLIYSSIQASLALDCVAGVCEQDSHGRFFLDLFDEDLDGAIGYAEFEDNSLIGSLLSPDVDMFDVDGNIRPRCDGIKDSLSFGAAFTAVSARFTPPQ